MQLHGEVRRWRPTKLRAVVVTFSEAGSADLTAIAELWFRAQAARRPGSFVTIADSREFVAQRAVQPGAWFLLAADNGRTVGIVYGAPGRKDDGAGRPIRGLLHLGMVAVDPARWGQGVGRELLQRSFDLAADRGFRRLQLWTHADNVRAQRLWERFGFVRSGRIKRDPRGETIVHYERELALPGTPSA